MKIDLIQPRHNYASDTGLGQIYMPTSLLTVGARLLGQGLEVEFHDENIRQANITSEYVGINLLGAPYIPEAIKLQDKINKEFGNKTYFIGGQVISGLTEQQFNKLFGDKTFNGNEDKNLTSILGIKELQISERTSLIPAYEILEDKDMCEYLSKEFSLYVSQGCKFACDFCGAARTTKNPLTGENIKVKEAYRDVEIIGKDLDYLVTKSKNFGLNELNLYMSNLDVFQTPLQLNKFAQAVKIVRNNHPGFDINLRGLATVTSFIETRNKSYKVIENLIEAGFNTVGFGIDGWSREEWVALHKGHNTKEKCLEAIKSARKDFGITPEILMVFGNPRTTKEKNIKEAYEITKMVIDEFKAVPRPHVSKDFIPGNEGWLSGEYRKEIESIINNPEAFQALDFTALPSELTHSDKKIRELATEYFLKMCNLSGNTTQYVKPITPGLSREDIEEIKKFNEGRFDR